ncbi:NADPH-dependent F420 reductase [Lacisediminihabitans profunda]|uniref:NADPH-dependent F420 reductase n=1 Tax=Lacisediminihabitans profunda TaxID=2594790 RepID=A0A5C8UNI5_9MICO|nr:NADPH-dependent F420 reductase [Lacisediminihabitans profunda]TXN29936.1 NADPH-dependent F420 reductase [Lacisediminihabitans profunda]
MTNVTIFGTGNMGTAIASVLAAGGASVEHIGSEGQGTITGDIVVLAVPYPALNVIATTYAEQLAGKIVVDITNPVDFSTFDSLVVPVGSSAAAELAKVLPSSKVLKAFNTNFAATLSSKKVGSVDTTVLIAGDDETAKQTLAGLVTAGGVRAVDAGSLKRAHELEALGFLQLALAAGEKISWTGGFGLIS